MLLVRLASLFLMLLEEDAALPACMVLLMAGSSARGQF